MWKEGGRLTQQPLVPRERRRVVGDWNSREQVEIGGRHHASCSFLFTNRSYQASLYDTLHPETPSSLFHHLVLTRGVICHFPMPGCGNHQRRKCVTLIRHLLPESEHDSFFFFPPIYKISMEEARWRAICPGNASTSAQDSWQFLTFEGKICSLRRAFTN